MRGRKAGKSCITGYGRPWAVEYRDDFENVSYALKLIKKDAQGNYILVSRNPDYPDIPVETERCFPIARFVERLGDQDSDE